MVGITPREFPGKHSTQTHTHTHTHQYTPSVCIVVQRSKEVTGVVFSLTSEHDYETAGLNENVTARLHLRVSYSVTEGS